MSRIHHVCTRRLVSLSCLIIVLLPLHSASATQTDISGPPGSDTFGSSVTLLPNGNFVVTDPTYTNPANPGVTNVGAVYLYDGATHAVISTLKGSTANDRVGGGGIVVLSNGHFVVRSTGWDNPSPALANVGAVTWCSAESGCNGVVSQANSLIGGTLNDSVGSVTVLLNGNYIVRSLDWDNPAGPVPNVGAVTWGNGLGGTTGVVTASNSLIGSSPFDRIGNASRALTNGNYVIGSTNWDSPSGSITDAGALTWGNGAGGTVGAVTSSNSLVGGKENDRVGIMTSLTNGNYVANTSEWDNPAGPTNVGAVTWCNGAGGTVGLITSANSLIGGTAGDRIGDEVVALANGNYVVRSAFWTNPSGPILNVGAATWGNGAGGTVGLVTSSNSLIGATAFDLIGGSGVTALTNGNYVVGSYVWNNPAGPITDVGAVTWGNGSIGTVGVVSASNSLIGATASDEVGRVTALSNGSYVVSSHLWDNPAGPIADVGAATWANGSVPTVGFISASNSLIGGTADDQVGRLGTTALTNGNYVVTSMNWDNPAGPIADVGAVTWCNGAGGTVGVVSASNSIIGASANDNVGNAGGSLFESNGVTPLTNGNYVVTSPFWDNSSPAKIDVGAVTWANGTGGTVGVVSSSNSIIGGTASDNIGSLPPSSNISNHVTALSSGHYMFDSLSWDNPSGPTANAGAVTLGNGTSGTVGSVSAANSVLGTVTNGISPISPSSPYSYDTTRNRLFVGRSASNVVSILFFTTTAVADGNSDNAAVWDNGVPNALTNVVIPSPRIVTVNAATTIGSLDLASGATLTMNANLNLTGRLALGTQINTGVSTLGLSCSSQVSGASSSNYVIGTLKKDFCAATSDFIYPKNLNINITGGASTGAFSFPTGTANGYSPVAVTVTSGTLNTNSQVIFPAYPLNPGSLSVKTNQGPQPDQNPTLSLQRYWTLTGSGLTADLTFNYLQSDVMGNESTYQLFKVVNGVTQRFPHSPPEVVIDTAANTAFIRSVDSFSDWTLGEPGAPTVVAKGVVSGRVATSNGTAVEGTVITLTGDQSRKTISDANGNYRFENVDTGGSYIVTPSRANYSFNPFSRSFSLLELETEATFTATLIGNSQNPLDTSEYFVRQQYIDFLGREPDEPGFNFWVDNINVCGQDAGCREVKRINTSGAFFLSIEFQETGYLVYRFYHSAYGDIPGTPVPLTRAEFKADTAQISAGVIVNQSGWEIVLETNKQAYAAAFVQRARFTASYPVTMTPTEFVDKLFTNAGVTPAASDRSTAINEFGSATDSSDVAARGRALRRVAENSLLVQQEFNQAFVLMQYFGYLTRDPNSGQDTNFDGYFFWLDKLNAFGGNFQEAEMVKAFLESIEYRGRFPQ